MMTRTRLSKSLILTASSVTLQTYITDNLATEYSKVWVTVKLSDANFLPGSDSVVVDVSGATFPHGLVSDLAVGVTVSFRGQVSGTGSATMLDVAGCAAGQRHSEQHGKR